MISGFANTSLVVAHTTSSISFSDKAALAANYTDFLYAVGHFRVA
jgi:hypothetical protein